MFLLALISNPSWFYGLFLFIIIVGCSCLFLLLFPFVHFCWLCLLLLLVALVRFVVCPCLFLMFERTIPTERQPLVGEVSANLLRDPCGRILGFLDRSRYFFSQVAPQLYSRGWVDPVPDPLLLRKSDSAGNRTRTSVSVARNSDR
jgi:hypothetical protein